ncbi:flagellar biosynthesis protein FlgN [Cupriavidus sp. USMAA2-4]|uniref:flagella synthesis protein FlgN n=1 Tax=Cupriavidus sp. USMAA2-4 TaxID=876364 RepID=UPI0008A6B0CC|nr:flagellar protein FlgN [Cupriavidus sp. USMAA2-4]AOY95732.1 flagellar biosynthesis protein FlgN [Cupriavidus sp. USMAA2-4]
MSLPLIQILHRETEAVKAFAEALADEREVMKSGDAQALGAVLDRKTALASALAELGAAREAQMAAAGLRAGPNGMLVGLRIDPAVHQAWRTLRLAALGAHQASTLNSAVIATHLEHTRAAIQVLRQRGIDAGLYGRDGRTQNAASGLSLARG